MEPDQRKIGFIVALLFALVAWQWQSLIPRTVKDPVIPLLPSHKAACTEANAISHSELANMLATNDLHPLTACATRRLQLAIQIQTVSLNEAEINVLEESNDSTIHRFNLFHSYLREEFPRIHKYFSVSVINRGSLVFEPPAKSRFLLYAHMDVVPGSGPNPFSGFWNATSGILSGRGALDMKSHLISFMTVVESYLNVCTNLKGMEQTMCYEKVNQWTIALGHDEETGGNNGAGKVREYLLSNGARFEAIFDEGLPALQSLIPLRGDPVVALIGVTERGMMNAKITVSSEGGHSSIAKWKHNPIHVLHSALDFIQSHSVVHSTSLPAIDMFKLLVLPAWARENQAFNTLYDFIGIPNLLGILFHRLIPFAAPNLSTSYAVTQFFAGKLDLVNVIPDNTTALINIRVHPADSCQSIKEYLSSKLQEFSITYPSSFSFKLEYPGLQYEPAPITPYRENERKSEYYHKLKDILYKTHRHHSPNSDVLVGPGVMVGGTDTKHFLDLIDGGVAFRVSPFVMKNKQDLAGIHGVNEYISIDNVGREVEFYFRLVEEFGV
ncbi:hypothetical protein HDU79_006939 [Rhizoclosmatium sp. JEL0117]|nr:hypothetical protein HDU79_006939 [Rhizoclosmatium sp. JEL0117]